MKQKIVDRLSVNKTTKFKLDRNSSSYPRQTTHEPEYYDQKIKEIENDLKNIF